MHWLILLATVLPVAAMMGVVALGYCMLKKMPIPRQTDTGTHFVKVWTKDRPECKNDHPECKNDHSECKNGQLELEHDHPEHVEVGAIYTTPSIVVQGEDSTCEDSSEEPVVDNRPRSSMTIGVETLRVVGLSVLQDLLLSLVQKHVEANAVRSHDDLESEVMTSIHDDLEQKVVTSGHDLEQKVVTSGHDDLEFNFVTSIHDDLEQKVVTSGHDDLESKVVTFGYDNLESVRMTSRQDEIEIKDVTSNHKDMTFKVVTSFHDDLKPEVVTSGHGTNSDGLARQTSYKQSNDSCLEHETDAVNCDPSHFIPECDREETLADGEGNTDGETTYDYKRDQQTLDKLSSLSSIAETDGVEEENVANLIDVLFVNDSVRRESFLSTLLAVRCTRLVQLLMDAIFRAFRLHNCVLRHWGKEQEVIEEGNDSGNVIYKINCHWNSITFSSITTTTNNGMGFIEATGALVDPKQEEERNSNWSECVAFRLANNMLCNKFTNMMPDSSSACVQPTHTDLDTREI